MSHRYRSHSETRVLRLHKGSLTCADEVLRSMADSPLQKIESLAKARRAADPSKTLEQHMADALLSREGSLLYNNYPEERAKEIEPSKSKPAPLATPEP